MRSRLTLFAGGLAVAVAAVVFAPRVLRSLAFFEVRQVEFVGLQYLSPEEVLAAFELEGDRNLFDDNREIERQIVRLPGVVDARVERRLPATLRVRVVERQPVAFAPGPAGLVALDRSGHPLPYDPTRADLHLPLVRRPDTGLVRTLALVLATDSLLYREVDGGRRRGDGAVVLELGSRQVLLPEFSTMYDVRAVEAVRQHLARSGRPFAQLDARFAGWVVVRRGGT